MKDGVLIERRTAERFASATKRVEGTPRDEADQAQFENTVPSDLVVAEITVIGTGGEYEAKEQIWDGSAFSDLATGRIWDGAANLVKLQEANLNAVIPVGTIVFPYFHGDDSGNGLWFFEGPAQTVSKHPFRMLKNAITDNKIDVGVDRSTAPGFKDRVIIGGKILELTSFDTTDALSDGEQWIFYKIQKRRRTVTDTLPPILTAELKSSTENFFPAALLPIPFEFGRRFDTANIRNVVIGVVTVTSGVVVAIRQFHHDNIILREQERNLTYYEDLGQVEIFHPFGYTINANDEKSLLSIPSDDTLHEIFLRYTNSSDTWAATLTDSGGNASTIRVGSIHVGTDGILKSLADFSQGKAFAWRKGTAAFVTQRDAGLSPDRNLSLTADLSEVRNVVAGLIDDLREVHILRSP